MGNQPKIAIVGLGYVGLPLAVAFAEKYPVVGLDINTSRIKELRSGTDTTLEVSDELLQSVLVTSSDAATGLYLTDQIDDMSSANVYIVTVPTPTDRNNRPVLVPMQKASESIAKVLNQLINPYEGQYLFLFPHNTSQIVPFSI